MQVVLTSQPVFDPRQARSWVKQYDIVDDKSIESAETVTKRQKVKKLRFLTHKKSKSKTKGQRSGAKLWTAEQNG